MYYTFIGGIYLWVKPVLCPSLPPRSQLAPYYNVYIYCEYYYVERFCYIIIFYVSDKSFSSYSCIIFIYLYIILGVVFFRALGKTLLRALLFFRRQKYYYYILITCCEKTSSRGQLIRNFILLYVPIRIIHARRFKEFSKLDSEPCHECVIFMRVY